MIKKRKTRWREKFRELFVQETCPNSDAKNNKNAEAKARGISALLAVTH